jgi:isoleucyl-tRNA synthetase
MDGYDVVRASRLLIDFVNELSTWYLRLSRERLKAADNQAASAVLGHTLYVLAQLFAPLTPFFSETVQQYLVDAESSIHLTAWPEVKTELQNAQLEKEMQVIRKIVETGHAQRREKALKVRQPLAGIKVVAPKLANETELAEVLLGELNVKHVTWKEMRYASEPEVQLETELTPELIAEGQAREVMRKIQQLRKEAGVAVDALVEVELPEWPEEWSDQIKAKTKVATLHRSDNWRVLPHTT